MRLLLLFLGSAALAFGAVAGVLLRPAAHVPARAASAASLPANSGLPAPSTDHHQGWTPLWTRPTPDVADVALAGDGATVAWVDNRGTVRRIAADTGKTLWQVNVPGLNRVVVGAQGEIFAYSLCNPEQASVHLFPSSSERPPAPVSAPRVVAFPVDGAVWSVATQIDGDSGAAIIGTGSSSIYVLPRQKMSSAVPALAAAGVNIMRAGQTTPTMTRIAVPGIPESLGVGRLAAGTSTASDLVVAGTRQPGGVSVWSGSGNRVRPPFLTVPADHAIDVHISEDGTIAAAINARRPHGADARIVIWDPRDGRLIRNEDLDGDDARALVSTKGNFIAVSYRGHGAKDPAGLRRIALFDRYGIRRFQDMGGRFFAPQLAALSVNGGHARITVYDDDGYIWTIDDRRLRSRFRIPTDVVTNTPPAIDRALSTPDGRYLLLRRGDGQISLYKARPE